MPIVGEIRTDEPTGYLSDGKMEFRRSIWDGTDWLPYESLWMEITDEARAELMAKQNAIASSPDVTEATIMQVKELMQEEDKITVTGTIPKDSDMGQAILSGAVTISHSMGYNSGVTSSANVSGQLPSLTIPESKNIIAGGCVGGVPDLNPIYPDYGTADAPLLGPATKATLESLPKEPALENSGFNVNYYSVEIKHPKREGKAPYTFEVEDLIEAMDMTFHEGNVLKSMIRSINERNHGPQKKGSDYIRDAEKMVHSSKEELRRRQLRALEGKK